MRSYTALPLLCLLCSCQMAPKERAPTSAATALYLSQAITAQGLFGKGIEGPAVDRDGNLYVVNFGKNGTIGHIAPGEQPVLWTALPETGIANSIRFNRQSDMYVADRINHRILKFDQVTKEISVVAEKSQMNQPNDFTINSQGELFLSDPSWSKKKSGHIWKVDRNQNVTLMADDQKAVNGIDLSPDEKTLYVTESIGGGLWAFDLIDGKLQNKRLLYQFEKDTVDGLRVDMSGVIYVARITKGSVDRISPEGELLGSVKTTGKEPTNLAFGGPDGCTVYVTIRDGGYIDSFRVPTPGREWALQQ